MGVDARMFVRIPSVLSDRDLRLIEHKLYQRFHDEITTYRDHFLERATTEDFEGYEIEPAVEGETVLRVGLLSRYYGLGYERGPFRFLHDLAEVLEAIIPGASIYYGGDSGDGLDLFDAVARAELRKHWIKNANEPYTNFFDRGERASAPKCRTCDLPMTRNGWGGGYSQHYCPCGEVRVQRGSAVTTTTRKERRDRFYALRNQALEALKQSNPTAADEWCELFVEDF